mmetsp:Transcript_22350/g.76649  ORF Transcript_22350/g.76649 Transcript_22350/m.76649 type:complete len:224 (-) Transcript_22350:1218-1889(-)
MRASRTPCLGETLASARLATRRIWRVDKRKAASALRDFVATSARSLESHFGASATKASRRSSFSHSGRMCVENNAANSGSSHAPGSATAKTRALEPVMREPSGSSNSPFAQSHPKAATKAPVGARCAPSRTTTPPCFAATAVGASRQTDAPLASVSRRWSRSLEVTSLCRWCVFTAAFALYSCKRAATKTDLPLPAEPTIKTCSPFSKSFRTDSKTFCWREER